MTRLSEIRDNITNTPPRLLRVIETLLEWCDPDLSEAHKSMVVLYQLVDRGLYPYRGRRPAHILGDGISALGPYREHGYIVDDWLLKLLTDDVYENILRLTEREGLPVLAARREDEPIRDFLLRMRAWCLCVRQGHATPDKSIAPRPTGSPLRRDEHRRYERPMSKREIGIALGLDPNDHKIAEKVDSMVESWGGQLHKVNRTNYLVPLDVLPPHFLERFRQYVKDFHHVDL